VTVTEGVVTEAFIQTIVSAEKLHHVAM